MLNRLPTSSSPLIRKMKFQTQQPNNHNSESLSEQASQNARSVIRGILRAEDTCPDDSSDCTAADEGCRCEGSLPLSSDVVRLVG